MNVCTEFGQYFRAPTPSSFFWFTCKLTTVFVVSYIDHVDLIIYLARNMSIENITIICEQSNIFSWNSVISCLRQSFLPYFSFNLHSLVQFLFLLFSLTKKITFSSYLLDRSDETWIFLFWIYKYFYGTTLNKCAKKEFY
jgi:hypothetical protein